MTLRTGDKLTAHITLPNGEKGRFDCIVTTMRMGLYPSQPPEADLTLWKLDCPASEISPVRVTMRLADVLEMALGVGP